MVALLWGELSGTVPGRYHPWGHLRSRGSWSITAPNGALFVGLLSSSEPAGCLQWLCSCFVPAAALRTAECCGISCPRSLLHWGHRWLELQDLVCALQPGLLQGGSTLHPAVQASDRQTALQLGSPKSGLFSTRHWAVVQYSKEQLEMRREMWQQGCDTVGRVGTALPASPHACFRARSASSSGQ